MSNVSEGAVGVAGRGRGVSDTAHIHAALDRWEKAANTTPESAEWGWWPGFGQPMTPLATDLPDPARVLALVAGLRAIVELHAPMECNNARCAGGGLHCYTCEEGLAADDNGGTVHYPCPTLAAVASAFGQEDHE